MIILRQERDDPLRSAIKAGRYGFVERGHLGDTHLVELS
jgi:hypothetical protein